MRHTKFELAKAIAELNDTYEFLEEISGPSFEKMIEKVANRDPDFIIHCELMEDPPNRILDFWSGFGIWTISRLRNKYRAIWSKVVKSYLNSGLVEKSLGKAVFKDQLNQILKDKKFE